VLSGTAESSLYNYILAGIIISHVCHLLSVLVLYRLLTVVLEPRQRPAIPFIAAVLHILTPASLFMSAPYAEAIFSLFNFTGMLIYAQVKSMADAQKPSIQQDIGMLSSGLFFAAATLMRSNGLLSGSIFLYDVATYLPGTLSAQLSMSDVRRIIVSCAAGTLIGLGFAGPQYLAYARFCSGGESRPWCEKTPPSIYSWVQSQYW
jgi:phosphatidylinositol glycan class V